MTTVFDFTDGTGDRLVVKQPTDRASLLVDAIGTEHRVAVALSTVSPTRPQLADVDRLIMAMLKYRAALASVEGSAARAKRG